MTAAVQVRRVRVQEWREIRDLRKEAVADPAAPIAFLTTPAEEARRDDRFWQDRAAGAALGDDGAQFVAEADGRWVGTATVLLRRPGSVDHTGGTVAGERADVVGVYVAPDHRGRGVLADLMHAAATWASERGVADLTLSTHVENLRAQAAYRKLGFVPTGETQTGSIGPEIVMRRAGSVSA